MVLIISLALGCSEMGRIESGSWNNREIGTREIDRRKYYQEKNNEYDVEYTRFDSNFFIF